MARIDERIFFILTVFTSLFVALNVQENLGLIYGLMGLFAMGGVVLDELFGNRTQIKIESGSISRLRALLVAIAGYFAVLFISQILIPILGKVGIITQSVSLPTLYSVVGLYSQTTLAFTGNLIFYFIAFGFLIPLIETRSWIVFFEFLVDMFKLRIDLKSFKIWSIIIIGGILFYIFHLTAKGISNDAALAVVFVFMVVTYVIVIIEKQSLDALLMHVFANSIALAFTYNLVPQLGTILWIIGGISVALIASQKIFKLDIINI